MHAHLPAVRHRPQHYCRRPTFIAKHTLEKAHMTKSHSDHAAGLMLSAHARRGRVPDHSMRAGYPNQALAPA
jgi:hypothetical protein